MHRFNESFQYSIEHGPSHGILYKKNELYFSRNTTRLQLAGDNPMVLDKDRIFANLKSPVLPSAPFSSCTSSQLAFVLQIAEDNVH